MTRISETEPVIFGNPKDNTILNNLKNDSSVLLFDLFESLKKELIKTTYSFLPKADQTQILSSLEPCWVYYPWNRQLFKLLKKEDFIKVRTSRNQYKITTEEQKALSKKIIGVVGLSVGRTVSTTLSMERVCGTLRLADFDDLELSNLNRIKAPLQDIGLLKTVSTCREIKEFDPYFNVQLFSEGLTKENLDDFFRKSGKLDIIVDECDSLQMKILLRKRAKELGVAVIMDTSDRGMLDIERYDLNPDLEYFNGRLNGFDPDYDWEITKEENQMLFSKIVDLEKLSERAKLSLSEIGKTITTWPQLASSVVLGGGVTAEICRRILLGENIRSGRFYIDLEELIPNEKG